MDARQFFAHPEYATRPERATHGLVVPIPAGAPLADLAPARLWSEALPVPRGHRLAELRRRRELRRPVPGPGIRQVLLRYADGQADLVLAAHRAVLGAAGLTRLAGELVAADPAAPPPDGPSWAVTDAPMWSVPVAPAPPFGLGDPARAGRYARITMAATTCPGPEPARLVAAVALVLARYGEAGAIGVVSGNGPDDRDTVRVSHPATVGGDTIDALVRGVAASLAGDSRPDRLPAVGVLLPGAGSAWRCESAAPPFPITIGWRLLPDGRLTGDCLFDQAYLSPPVAAGLVGQLIRAAGELAARPSSTVVDDLDLVSRVEAARILDAGRTPPRTVGPADATYVAAGTIAAAYAAVARRQPDAPACTDGVTTLTYRELDERADSLAAAMRERGVGPGTRVGVCLDRGVELVTVLLAVLKTGAAYVPMDVRAPADRLAFTVSDARPALVITDVAGFPAADGVPLASPGALRAAGPGDGSAAGTVGRGDDTAYIIYTSGSTGRPKGVVVAHRNVLALLDATADDMRLGPDDAWTLFHSSAFDFSVWEIWGCLLTGGRLVCVRYWVSRSPDEFRELLVRERVTVLSQTPSAFVQLCDADAHAATSAANAAGAGVGGLAVRLVVFGGEPLDVAALRPWYDRYPRTRLVNMYGITETTVHVTTHTVTPADMASGSRSVGTALPGWSVSVRDDRGRPLPFGAPGEIYVGGAGVADGYLNREELTRERFLLDEHTAATVYRSGDRGRLRPDGQLEHLGRLDNQVQLRGHRVELGEVRAVLLEDPFVTAAAVVVAAGPGGAPGSARLDAYVVLHGGSVADVRHRAARMLPEYMLPSTVTALPELPLTLNGKLDVEALPVPGGCATPTPEGSATPTPDGSATPAPDGSATPAPERGGGPVRRSVAAEGEDPGGITGTMLRIWRGVFGRAVGTDDDFFELGGNSLLAVRLFAAHRDAGLPRVSLRELYLRPTIAGLAEVMAQAPAAAGA